MKVGQVHKENVKNRIGQCEIDEAKHSLVNLKQPIHLFKVVLLSIKVQMNSSIWTGLLHLWQTELT